MQTTSRNPKTRSLNVGVNTDADCTVLYDVDETGAINASDGCS